MRILHVISSVDRKHGGPTAALLGLAFAQVRLGMDVSVVSSFRVDEEVGLVKSFEAFGVHVHLIGPGSRRLVRVNGLAQKMSGLVVGRDIIHIHALWEEIQHQAAMSGRRLEVPYIFRPCGMLDPWSLSQSKWAKKLMLLLRLKRDLNGAAAIHYTADLERDLAGAVGIRGPRPIVEPNGVDFSEFDPLPERGGLRRRFPELGDRPIVLFLSRIHPKKGLDLLIPAFARGGPSDARLVLAGPGEDAYIAELQALARTHGIADRITWTGMLHGRERIEAYVDADLFVLPSYQENFGIAVVEALAAGTPVVISDQVAIWRELKAAGVAGVVPTQVEPLVIEMRRWLGDHSLRQQAGGRARAFAFEHYDWNAIARRWIGHYRKLANTTKPVSKVVDL